MLFNMYIVIFKNCYIIFTYLFRVGGLYNHATYAHLA